MTLPHRVHALTYSPSSSVGSLIWGSDDERAFKLTAGSDSDDASSQSDYSRRRKPTGSMSEVSLLPQPEHTAPQIIARGPVRCCCAHVINTFFA
jgi:hypothetical protein